MRQRRHACRAAFVLVIALTATAAAQGRNAEAELLFNQGKAEMAKGNYADACRKFQSSFDLAPRVSTLMNLGACQEADKKLVSAWISFVEAARLAARSPDEKALIEPSQKKAKALEARLSSIKIVVPTDSRLPGLEITRDGERIVEGQWNSEIYIDGGEYTIVARAPGTTAWTAKVSIASELDREQLEIPRLRSGNPPEGGPPVRDVAAEPGAPGRFTTMRKAAVALAVVGVVGVGVGVGFGVQANSRQDEADAICPGTICNDAEGLRLNDEAQSAATKANIGFIGGGLAIAGGVALWLLGGPSEPADRAVILTPLVGADRVGLSLARRF